jgi:hypothetical protein
MCPIFTPKLLGIDHPKTGIVELFSDLDSIVDGCRWLICASDLVKR